VNSLAAELAAANVEVGGNLILDFSNIRRINSVELGTLIELHKRLEARGVRLTLIRIDSNVREVFAVTRLDSFLSINPEET
jgi:anti-anti-sigma factor